MLEIKFRKDLGLLLSHFSLPRVVCEVGNAEGRFSQEICQWGIDRLYMIDLWQRIVGQSGDGNFPNEWHENNFMEAMQRTSQWQHKVTVLRGLAKDMIPMIPDNSLGIVYIDAAHDYDSVVSDLVLSFKKVVSGGIISGHDYLGYPSVNRAVNDFCGNCGYKINIIPEDEPNNASFYFIKP